MKNFEAQRRDGDHKWENNGKATVVRVGPLASSSISPPDDDPNPGGGGEEGGSEEGPPPPDPAKDSDVNGDDHADLVALHTSGVAHTYNAFDASDQTTAFGGGMNSALFDGSEHHVIDVSDVNADGYADLVTLCFNSPIGIDKAVCVFPGQDSNTFGAGIIARGKINPGTLGPNGHEPIGVADVNGDLLGDLVTFFAPQGNFYVYPGLANGQFGEGMTFGGGQINSALFDRQGLYVLDVADVDGDGHADVVTTSTWGTAEVYKGSAGGIQQSPTQVNPAVDPIMDNGTGQEPIGLGDVDGNGKADLVTLNSSGSISVYAGMQSSTQLLATSAVTSLPGQNSSLTDETGDDFVGLLDRTGDGKADLVKITSEGVVYIAPGQGELKFGAFAYFRNGVTPNRFAKAGFEQVFEKPFIRRIGCSSSGCLDRPRAMESDVDGDLRSDLVTLDSAGTSHVYRAIGEVGHATSFAGAMDSALFDGSGHHVIDVADVTGDWRADKVTLRDDGSVYVYRGELNGTFAGTGTASFAGSMTPGPYSPTGFEPIAVADVTGDTHADLVAFKDGQGVKVYPGKGDGIFGSPIVSLSAANSARFDQTGYHFLDVVDVTGDRRADLVASGAADDTIRVFKGNSNGTLALDGVANLPLRLDEGAGQELVGLGDVNGDGRADLATLTQGTVNVYEGRANGEFTTEESGGPAPTGTSFSGSLDSNLFDQTGDEIAGLLDENGDRKADLVTVRSDGSARIYRGKANFTFDQTAAVRTLPDFSPARFKRLPGHEVVNEKPAFMRAGCTSSDCPWPPIPFVRRDEDSDGDYRADLISVDTAGTAHLFAGGPSGILTQSVKSLVGQLDPALRDGKGHYFVDATDVNNNGFADLVTVKDDGKVLVHLGQGDRTFGVAVDTGISLPPVMNGTGHNEPIAVADVTGDGFDDLIAFVGPGSGQIRVYKGQSDGKFATTAVQSLSGAINSAMQDNVGSYFLDAVDVTGDQRADLVAMQTTGTSKVFPGQADGTFASGAVAASIDPIMDNGSGQEPAGLGDVDADGKADLLTLDQGSLKLYKGQSGGTFASPTSPYAGTIDSSLFDGSGQELIGLLDYTRDGRTDLVSSRDNGDVLTYTAQPNGTFAAPTTQQGPIVSTRVSTGSAHQFVTEKPLSLRAGCSLGSCRWVADPVTSDVNGDGRSDLVTLRPDGTVQVRSGEPDGTFGAPTVSFSNGAGAGTLNPAQYDGIGHYAIDVADVDANGYADLITLSNDGKAHVYPGDPDRTFDAQGKDQAGTTTNLALTPGLLAPGGHEPIAVADVTGEGRADLISYDDVGDKVMVYPGDPNRAFGAGVLARSAVSSALHTGSGEYFLDAADVTGDGKADLVSMTTTNNLRVYPGKAGGTFDAPFDSHKGEITPSSSDGVGYEPGGLGDVTGDGKADLVLMQGKSVRLYPGKAEGGFGTLVTSYENTAKTSTYGPASDRTEVAGLLDVTGDGLADFTATISGLTYILKGQASGVFASSVITPEGNFLTTQHNQTASTRQEMVSEKPSWKRRGCLAKGCRWVIEATANAIAANNNRLTDVSCSATNSCFASANLIWSGNSYAYLQRWDGTSWVQQVFPENAKTELSGVACTSSTSCTAVGSKTEANGDVVNLAVRWDGTSWTKQTITNPPTTINNRLTDVSCAAANSCFATANLISGGNSYAYLQRWDGTTWTQQVFPENAKTELSGISCSSATACTAVGSKTEASGEVVTLAVRWDGTSWAKQTTPNAAGTNNRMTDVSCPSATFCFATANLISGGVSYSYGEHWNGSAWAQQGGVPENSKTEFNGVSCVSSTSCSLVGRQTEASGTVITLAVRWEKLQMGPPGAPERGRGQRQPPRQRLLRLGALRRRRQLHRCRRGGLDPGRAERSLGRPPIYSPTHTARMRTVLNIRRRHLLGLLSILVLILVAAPASTAGAAQNHWNWLDRTFAIENAKLDIDGVDDYRVDATVAVMDTGIELDNPDLNVVGGVDCTGVENPAVEKCDESAGAGDDDGVGTPWHGTAAAENIGALDNGINGTLGAGVGMAPGVRLWAIDAVDDTLWGLINGSGGAFEWDLAPSIAAFKWVAKAQKDGDPKNDIDVLIGGPNNVCSRTSQAPRAYMYCANAGQIAEHDQALKEMVDAGVVYVVAAAAGDETGETGQFSYDAGDMVGPGTLTRSPSPR